MDELLRRDLPAWPYLFLYHLKWLWGVSAKLSGVVPHPDGDHPPARAAAAL
jgi:hypothetical protein